MNALQTIIGVEEHGVRADGVRGRLREAVVAPEALLVDDKHRCAKDAFLSSCGVVRFNLRVAIRRVNGGFDALRVLATGANQGADLLCIAEVSVIGKGRMTGGTDEVFAPPLVERDDSYPHRALGVGGIDARHPKAQAVTKCRAL